MRPWKRPYVLAALLAVGLVACHDETTPPPATPDPTLDNAWPNEDGLSWTYKLHQRLANEFMIVEYDSASQVPEVTLDDAEALLAHHPLGETQDFDGLYRLVFDGTTTTMSGATGQNLRQELYEEIQPGPMPVEPRAAPAFLQRLAHARPDLRGEIRKQFPDFPEPETTTQVAWPLLLHGGAFEKTSSHIGSYGDIDTLLAWKFLEATLDPGHEFTHQLVPAFADDVFLHARVLDHGPVETEAGTYAKTVRVLYLVDFGISETFEGKYFRIFDYGESDYAPETGPVRSYQRSGVSGEPPTAGFMDQMLDLVD